MAKQLPSSHDQFKLALFGLFSSWDSFALDLMKLPDADFKLVLDCVQVTNALKIFIDDLGFLEEFDGFVSLQQVSLDDLN